LKNGMEYVEFWLETKGARIDFSSICRILIGDFLRSSAMQCGQCGFDNPDGFAFCGQCGSPLLTSLTLCSRCGFRNPLHLAFCGHCGQPLTLLEQLTPADLDHLRVYLPSELIEALHFDLAALPPRLAQCFPVFARLQAALDLAAARRISSLT